MIKEIKAYADTKGNIYTCKKEALYAEIIVVLGEIKRTSNTLIFEVSEEQINRIKDLLKQFTELKNEYNKEG